MATRHILGLNRGFYNFFDPESKLHLTLARPAVTIDGDIPNTKAIMKALKSGKLVCKAIPGPQVEAPKPAVKEKVKEQVEEVKKQVEEVKAEPEEKPVEEETPAEDTSTEKSAKKSREKTR